MNRDDVIRMAREAGFEPYETLSTRLQDFAALVAAAEREACAIAGGAASDAGVDVAAAIRARREK